MPRPSNGCSDGTGRVKLRVELLEDRTAPSASFDDEFGGFAPVIMAGDSRGPMADPHINRIDANTAESPFAGVGSLQILARSGRYIGTATAIGPRHILTAAHLLDINNDGKVDARDRLTGVYFVLNSGGDQSHRIAVAGYDLHPDYTGFNKPSIHDDIAVLTLAEDLPLGLPTYALPQYDLMVGNHITLVGYGRSGYGTGGYSTPATLTIKRVGENMVDAFYGQDDLNRPFVNEVFRFDFDRPDLKVFGPLGGPTVGPYRETTLGPGDSGGPSFVVQNGQYVVAGVNTFTQGAAPRYGSMAGGMNVYAYLDWINSIIIPDLTIPAPGAYREPGTIYMPLPLVPGVGSATTTPVGVGTVGVRVGARKVGDQVAFTGLEATDPGRAFTPVRPSWDVEDRKSTSTDSLALSPSDPAPAEDWLGVPLFGLTHPFGTDVELSVDAGLLALATGEQLTLDA